MSQDVVETEQTSKFDGGLAQWIGWNILGFLVTVLTIGICYPCSCCMVYGWKINHTIVEGKRLHFEGKAISLFGLWLKWILLSIVTVGIYIFWIPISLEKWKVKNTKYEDGTPFVNEEGAKKAASKFDGGLGQFIGWHILGFFVTLLTAGLCYPCSCCWIYGWKINHTNVEGKRLHFEGRAISLFGLWLKWILLSIVTVGIYIFWIPISLEKWKVKNTRFANEEEEKEAIAETSTTPVKLDTTSMIILMIGSIVALGGCLKPLTSLFKNIPGFFFYNFQRNFYESGVVGIIYAVFTLLSKLTVVGVAVTSVIAIVNTTKGTLKASTVSSCLTLAIVHVVLGIFINCLLYMFCYDYPSFGRYMTILPNFFRNNIPTIIILIGAITLKVSYGKIMKKSIKANS